MRFEINVEDWDELWPKRKTLVGLKFASEAEYERAVHLVESWGFDFYKELYDGSRLIVVRKREVDRFSGSGLSFREIDQIDDEDMDPEDVRRRNRAVIAAAREMIRERERRGE